MEVEEIEELADILQEELSTRHSNLTRKFICVVCEQRWEETRVPFFHAENYVVYKEGYNGKLKGPCGPEVQDLQTEKEGENTTTPASRKTPDEAIGYLILFCFCLGGFILFPDFQKDWNSALALIVIICLGYLGVFVYTWIRKQ